MTPASPPAARAPDLTPTLLAIASALLLLQRFWLAASVPWIFPLVAGALLIATARGALVVQPQRLAAFLVLGALALATTLANGALGHFFSVKSLAYLLTMYSLFVLTPAAPPDQRRLLRFWQWLSLGCALLGILQFGAFLATGQVFDLLELLPARMAENTGYVPIQLDPTETVLRANGIVFLEASFFSQFMALALVVEAALFRNPYRLACFAIALACTLSGTGMLMVGAAVLAGALLYPTAAMQRRAVLPLGGGLLACLVLIAGVPVLGSYVGERLGELLTLEPRESSAYIRFIAPWVAVYRTGELGVTEALLGLGPGLITLPRLHMTIMPNLNPISQIGVYYGIVTTVAFVAFLGVVTIRRYTRPQWVIMVTVVFQYLFCAGNLLAPSIAYVLLWFVLVLSPSETSA